MHYSRDTIDIVLRVVFNLSPFATQEDLGGEGISVCGALFALFLSVCPLLGYQDGTGLTRGGRGIDGRGGVGAKRGWVGEGRCSGRRAGPCLAATMGLLGGGDDDDVGGGQASRVAVAAGELLQVRFSPS